MLDGDEKEENQGKLMYANSEGQASQPTCSSHEQSSCFFQEQSNCDYSCGTYRIRGCGGRFYYRGRGRGRTTEEEMRQK